VSDETPTPPETTLDAIRARHAVVLRSVGQFTQRDVELSPVAQLYVDRAWLLGAYDRLVIERDALQVQLDALRQALAERAIGDTRSGA